MAARAASSLVHERAHTAAAGARSRQRTRGSRGPAFACTHRSAARQPLLDAVIVGGGPAGLSAALVLGRARRKVLVLDHGRPANAAATTAIGGLLANDVSPLELRRAGREQLDEHPSVAVREQEVVHAEPIPDGFAIALDDGTTVRSRALVLAHGLRYDPPPLPGVDPLWGRSVFHCPFCDGWEVRDRPLAVHGNDRGAAQSALNLVGWSNDVVLCTDGPSRLNGERALLDAAGVRVREEPIRALSGADGRLERIEFMAGPPEDREALFVRTRREQPNGLAAALGCRLGPDGTIETDADGRTGVPCLYAAGDAATDHSRSVANAIGTGSRVAYAVALAAVTQRA